MKSAVHRTTRRRRGDARADHETTATASTTHLLTMVSLAREGTAMTALMSSGGAILHNALEYAVELRHLDHNPVEVMEWKAPKTTSEVDRRCVVNHAQARGLFDSVRAQEPSGPRLAAFYAVMYYAGLRPEEAVSIRRDNIILPPLLRNEETGAREEPADGWGELRLAAAAPEVGAEWIDDGQRHDHRHLKARAPGEWRHVPAPPPLVRLLRKHLEDFPNGRNGLVFTGVQGGELASVTYRRVWDRARQATFTPAGCRMPAPTRYDWTGRQGTSPVAGASGRGGTLRGVALGLLGLSWADGAGVTRLPPQPPGNLGHGAWRPSWSPRPPPEAIKRHGGI
jgi:integrase